MLSVLSHYVYLRPGNVSFKLSFLIPFLIINANQLRFFVVYCTSYNLIAVGQSRDCVYFEMWFLLLRSFLFIRIRILNGQRKVVNKKVGKQTAWVNKVIARPGLRPRKKNRKDKRRRCNNNYFIPGVMAVRSCCLFLALLIFFSSHFLTVFSVVSCLSFLEFVFF